MSAVNPYTPPRAAVSDVHKEAVAYSQPKVWAAGGRIGRLRYLAYLMVGYLVMILGAVVIAGIGGAAGLPMLAAGAIFIALVPYMVLSVLCAIQRAHDMDWSGWTVPLMLIPLVAFVWLFKSGTPGANRFGAPPPPNTTGVIVGAWMTLGIPVIIGILAAISIPAYNDYVKRARAKQMPMQTPPAPQPSSQQ